MRMEASFELGKFSVLWNFLCWWFDVKGKLKNLFIFSFRKILPQETRKRKFFLHILRFSPIFPSKRRKTFSLPTFFGCVIFVRFLFLWKFKYIFSSYGMNRINLVSSTHTHNFLCFMNPNHPLISILCFIL